MEHCQEQANAGTVSLPAMIPVVNLNGSTGSLAMPLVSFGTAAYPFAPENTKTAIIKAIEASYRHFDTASLYLSEMPLGEAISEALLLGLITCRTELFITSKLWCNDCHPHLVLPALRKSLR